MKLYDTRAAADQRIQKILRLRLVEGLSVQQIAERFSISRLTVYYLVNRHGPRKESQNGSTQNPTQSRRRRHRDSISW